MIQTLERTKIAQEVLDTHAEDLKSEFSTFEELQDLFIDVFSSDINSSENLASLQNQFANGTLRPEIKFVSSEVLTDDYGNIRDAAFESTTQTILLSEDLDAAGIESSIEQEIGHWWDVRLNGTKDTTLDGKPFDEGAAYAERFSEGAEGDNIFADIVYQNDSQTILVDGKETEVEFRPIATWNMQGGTNNGNNTWVNVFETIENPGQGQGPIEVMAVQEAGPSNNGILDRLEDVADDGNLQTNETRFNDVVRFSFERNNVPYDVYWTNGGLLENLPVAIILREPPQGVEAEYIRNPANPDNFRPILGVNIPNEGYYFSVHAQAGTGLNRGNDAEELLDNTIENGDLDPDLPKFVLGDFNRNIAVDGNPTGNMDAAFPDYADSLIPPDATTQNARENPTENTLDYMFTEADLVTRGGSVLNQLPNANTGNFPSDHFPVLYDDELAPADASNDFV